MLELIRISRYHNGRLTRINQDLELVLLSAIQADKVATSVGQCDDTENLGDENDP